MAFFNTIPISTISLSWAIGLALGLWCLGLAVYRLYFSPIAKFPGPKLAALTLWYEFYYDVLGPGQYVFKIRELHKQYGPIIRISPYELHIDTPEYYQELYPGPGSNKKRNKYEWFTKMFATPQAAFGTVDHDLHRMRRAAMNPFFSTASVRRLQPIIHERIEQLMSRIKGFKASGEPLTISLAYVAFSSDVVTKYAFGRDYRRLEMEDFDPKYAQSMHEGTAAAHFNKQIFWPFQLLLSLPDSWATKVAPGLYLYIAFIRDCERQIKAIMNGSNEKQTQWSHPTIFHELLEKDLPASEKSMSRLVQEGQIIVSAGTETTAWCLSVITFHLLSNPAILENLRKELEKAIPDPNNIPPVEQLERLPYLTACIQEGLRLSYGLSTRLARISPDSVMIFNDGEKDWQIPAGTPTSMTSYLIHHNETIFPSSHDYVPQRWLDNPRLDRYLISFTKGTRQCVGINLAYTELYICLATLFRRYGGPESVGPGPKLELFESTIDDVKMVADRFLPFVKPGSKGIRVLVK